MGRLSLTLFKVNEPKYLRILFINSRLGSLSVSAIFHVFLKILCDFLESLNVAWKVWMCWSHSALVFNFVLKMALLKLLDCYPVLICDLHLFEFLVVLHIDWAPSIFRVVIQVLTSNVKIFSNYFDLIDIKFTLILGYDAISTI